MANIAANKELAKRLERTDYYSVEDFINDGIRYIKASKEGGVICSIGSVAQSGMSRTIKFLECAKRRHIANGPTHQYLNFFAFFSALGYNSVGRYSDYFRIRGAGMDMIFHTNYTNMHRLQRLGFISKKQCASLAQDTPKVI